VRHAAHKLLFNPEVGLRLTFQVKNNYAFASCTYSTGFDFNAFVIAKKLIYD